MDFEKDREAIQQGLEQTQEIEGLGELNRQAEPEREMIYAPPVRGDYPQRPRSKASMLKVLAWVLIGAVLGSGLTFSAGYYFLPELLAARGIGFNGQQSITIESNSDLSVYTAVAQKAMPSVVGITTVSLQNSFFGTSQPVEGVGTGVIVDERGYILTNAHVVGDSEQIAVTLYDNSQLSAQVIWQDSNLDLAVIKVEGEEQLPVAELGDSDTLEVGEIAIAIGNPLGLTFERSLTQGVISGLNRNIAVDNQTTIENLIQTDASINPGNSGGPLLNSQGQVIGINTAKIQTGEGLGFAIPINTAKPIVEEIIENGEFSRVVMGIAGVNVDVFEANTGVELQADEGVYVVEIVAGSSAERAGLMAGDVITGIGSTTITTMGSLQRELYEYRPGDETTLTILREGQATELTIVFEQS